MEGKGLTRELWTPSRLGRCGPRQPRRNQQTGRGYAEPRPVSSHTALVNQGSPHKAYPLLASTFQALEKQTTGSRKAVGGLENGSSKKTMHNLILFLKRKKYRAIGFKCLQGGGEKQMLPTILQPFKRKRKLVVIVGQDINE